MLNLQQISVSYGDTQIVRGVDMTIGRGELVCLMGRNGVGKSTLLKSIIGLLPLNSGRIEFEGRDISKASPDKRARLGIGYVPQGREIFPGLTVLENLKIGLLANPGRLAEVPEQIFDYFPMLKSILNRKGGVLSGGQQQQLAIARALAAEPKLLILDEPTEGIQPSIILLIGQFLETLRKKGRVAVLLVEQYLDFALKLADSCYVMEKGQIAMNGRVESLDKEVIKHYLVFKLLLTGVLQTAACTEMRDEGSCQARCRMTIRPCGEIMAPSQFQTAHARNPKRRTEASPKMCS